MARPGLRLAEAQREQLIIEFQRARGSKDLDMVSRIQGLLLVSEGMGERRAAQMVGVGRRTLQDWIFKFRQNGFKGLVKGPYPGRRPKLTPDQLRELAQVIERGLANPGLHTGVWTASLAAHVVNKLFGIRYHPDHMRKILRCLGFTVQLPRRELSRADPADQSHWLTQELAVLKKESSRSVECSSTRTKHHSAKPARSIERGQERARDHGEELPRAQERESHGRGPSW